MNSDSFDWSAKRDKEVTVSGVAQNAKAGALLMTGPEHAILLQGVSEWDSGQVGKKVVVEAVVRRSPGYPKAGADQGPPMQGTATGRDTWVLEVKCYRMLD